MYCVLVDFAVGSTFPLLVCYIYSWSIYFCVGWEICIMQNYKRSVWYLYQSVYLWYFVFFFLDKLFVVLRGEYYSFDRVFFSGYVLFVSVMHRLIVPIEASIDCSIIELD